MPKPNARPFVAIGRAYATKRDAAEQARSLTKGHPTHIYTVTSKTDKGYYVKRVS